MTVPPVSLEAMSGAAGHVMQEYGDNYSIRVVEGAFFGGGVFEVRASDGAEFAILVDRWGNARRCCDRRDENRRWCTGNYEGAVYRPTGEYLCVEHQKPAGCRHIDPSGQDRACYCPDAEELAAWKARQ
jgi:hypothetical protein